MQDSVAVSHQIDLFKQNVFIWEVVFTAVIFAAGFYFLKDFKKKEIQAKKDNQKYYKDKD